MGCLGFSKRLNPRKSKKKLKDHKTRGQEQPAQLVQQRQAPATHADDPDPEPWSMGAIKRRTAMLEKERHTQRLAEPLAANRAVSGPEINRHQQEGGNAVGGHLAEQPPLRMKTWTWGADAKISAADLMNLRALSPDVEGRIQDQDDKKRFGGKGDAKVGLEDYELGASYQRGGLKAL